MQINSEKSITNFKPIVNVLKWLCLIPPYSFEKNTLSITKWYKFGVCLLTMVPVVLMAVTLRIKARSPIHDVVVNSLDILMNIFGHACIFNGVVRSYVHRRLWSKIFQAFHFLKGLNGFNLISIRNDAPKLIHPVYLQIIFCNCFIAFLLIIVHLEWIISTFNLEVPVKYVLCYMELDVLATYYISMNIFAGCHILALITARYQDLHNNIEKLSHSEGMSEHLFFLKFKKIETIYYHLQEIVDSYNKIFRTQNWLTLSYGFIATLYFGLSLSNYPHETSEGIMIFMCLAPIPFCIYFCDATKRAHEKLIASSFTVEQTFSEKRLLRMELQYLTFKLKILDREFTASGYFPIKRTLLLTLCGVFANYFIALEQIWHTQNDGVFGDPKDWKMFLKVNGTLGEIFAKYDL